MRLHRLSLTAFGPFPETIEIPFEELEKGGEPFLLTGPTGSGKTTVLDAVCYALYGRVPRSGQNPDVVSRHRDPGTTPSVELELTIADQRLRVKRIPPHTRPKLKGEGTTSAPHKVVVSRKEGDDWIELATSIADADRELEQERLRMTEDQFGQVVMLPQGDFARFLKSKPDERKSLLQKLFPGEDMGDVQDWLETRAGEAREKRDEHRRNLELEINKAWVEVSEAAEERGEEPPEPPNHLDRVMLGQRLAEARVPLDATATRARDEERSTGEVRDAALKEKTELERRAKLVEERGQKEDHLADLIAGRDEVDALDLKAKRAERAALVEPFINAAGTRAEEHAKVLAERDSLLEKLAGNPTVGTVDRSELATRRDELAAGLASVKDFEEEGLEELQRLEGEAAELDRLARELDDPESELNRERAAAAKKVESATSEVATRKSTLLEIREARNLGMAAELAGELKDGAPCVVCGSTEHPSPAKLPEGTAAYEKRDEEEAETKVAEAESAKESAREALNSVDLKLGQLRTRIEADLESTGKAVAAARRQESELLKGEATIAARIELLNDLIESIGNCLAAIEKEETGRREAEKSAADLEEALAAQKFDSAEEAAGAVLEKAELARIRAAITSHEADLKATRSRLEEAELATVDRNEVIDTTRATEKAEEAEAAHKASVERLTTASNRLSNFDARAKAIPKLLEELEPLEQEADRISGLADLARGRNRLKIQLSNFVLASRLKQVIAAANRKLGPMSANRYQLVYEEPEGGQGQKGLGIRIFDSHTSDERGVETLSGGETFYASLSLALGLAEVVQMESGGRPIETLFIDEGFGTLDSGSLDQVMNEIENLRANGRTVGLVSHVEELRNRIQTQIQVTPSRDGSRLEIVGIQDAAT